MGTSQFIINLLFFVFLYIYRSILTAKNALFTPFFKKAWGDIPIVFFKLFIVHVRNVKIQDMKSLILHKASKSAFSSLLVCL